MTNINLYATIYPPLRKFPLIPLPFITSICIFLHFALPPSSCFMRHLLITLHIPIWFPPWGFNYILCLPTQWLYIYCIVLISLLKYQVHHLPFWYYIYFLSSYNPFENTRMVLCFYSTWFSFLKHPFISLI
jgi:hypothetical protein